MNQALLVYDGACPVCRRARDWVASLARPGALRFLPCQSEERPRLAPRVSEDDCMKAVQLVLPGGRVYAGAEAVKHLLPLLRWPYRWLGLPLHVPGANLAAKPTYRLIAHHRGEISALLGLHSCEEDGCKVDVVDSGTGPEK